MSELEQALVALGRDLDYPETPSLGGRVRARIERRPFLRRRGVVAALAALAVAIAAALAVPQARTAILELLGLRGVAIERVGELPEAEPRGDLAYLGDEVSFEEAERRTPYALVRPHLEGLGEPHAFHRTYPGSAVTLVYGEVDRPRLVLTQFRARIDEILVQKMVGSGTRVRRVSVGGERAIWLAGEPHAFAFVAPDGEFVQDSFYLARNTLLWERESLTLRIEGAFDLEQALEIASSVR